MQDKASPSIVRTWAEIPSEDVREGVRRRAFGTKNVMLVMNDIDAKMLAAPHSHPDFEQIALILKGNAIYHIGDIGHRVGPGSIMVIPAGVEHWIEPDGDEAIENLDVFAPPRADFSHLVTWMTDASSEPAQD